ncbi:MAG: long-chain-fatty-acid--CoA ligase [Polyangia bacterium]|nr:long-chain-fatty-acid--CoA ligase [Polyangia bacterium]
MKRAMVPSLWSLLDRAADLFPGYPAVVEPGRRETYAEVHRAALALARHLYKDGPGRGERVAYLGVNSGAFLASYFAAAGAGLALVPLNLRLAPKELSAILNDSEARFIIADVGQAASLRDTAKAGARMDHLIWTGMDVPEADLPRPGGASTTSLREVLDGSMAALEGEDERLEPLVPGAGDEVAQLYYTSGTTGAPKGVILTHRNVWSHSLGAIAELGLGPEDRWGHMAPMFHLADAWATFAVTWVGGCHVMVPRFSPESAFEAIASEGITVTNLVPTMLNLMARHPQARSYDRSSMRLLLSGGAPIAPSLVGELAELFGCEYVQTYGMTETSPYLTLSIPKPHLRAGQPDRELRVRAKTGRAFATVELRLVDDAGHLVPRDERSVGEIQVRGESVTPGYWRRPEETASAFTEGGWLRTGDLAVWDSEGYVDIVDRKKDMIISGGENIYSTEVEHALYEHDAVLEAAVVGVPDERWGEVVLAAVVLRPGREASSEELRAFCRQRLAGYKTPKYIEFLPELPRTGTGKILKAGIRERFGHPRSG